ncbi:piggyBac transposable element-derived protein 4-like [Zootermopsis nevadensis]|uniref:piggyBac transposable element-derived protein 4-like n=1 Tax=Zootermopsis nevadensis TaxID=136037 RepID=UPI000B8E70A8|nr:piggyBac transposable element-derived protein 4-like [Zootermopsis nevadensis]XP_021918753.1 piggyBac transposable element-derived protein 4-like [Zootermopsis nevadensis]
MDNFYNAPALAQILKSLKTDCVGTLRINRKDVPLAVKEKKLKKGELIAQHSGPVSVLKWSDKKNVTMISTYHGDDTQKVKTKGGQEKENPASVLDYNKNMIGVDLKDQLLHNYLLERKKMTKWYIKMFMRLLNATILNSMIICRANSPGIEVEHLKYRVDLVQALLVEHGGGVERNVPGRHSTDKTVPRLIERHFPERIPPTEKKSRPTKRCVVCYKQGKRKETVFWCPDCEAGLCVDGCFKIFHTKLNF